MGTSRRPENKQGIEGKIVRFRSGRVRDRVRVRDKDRRSKPQNQIAGLKPLILAPVKIQIADLNLNTVVFG